MPMDGVMVVRCRYCVLDNEFVAMPAYKDGRFVCIWCAHTVRVDDPMYHCTCRRCLEMTKHHQSIQEKT